MNSTTSDLEEQLRNMLKDYAVTHIDPVTKLMVIDQLNPGKTVAALTLLITKARINEARGFYSNDAELNAVVQERVAALQSTMKELGNEQ